MKYRHTARFFTLILITLTVASCVSRNSADGTTVGEAFGRFIAAEGNQNQIPLFGQGTAQQSQ